MALIDEVGVLVAISMFCTTVFINGSLNRTTQKLIGFAFGAVVEAVLILNFVFTYIYFKQRNPPKLELEQIISLAPVKRMMPR